jgi:DNA-binding XRE family transcriptional regulator
MTKAQRERLERAGWKIGTVGDLLELTPAEEALVDAKVQLGAVVRTLRRRGGLSQAELAKRMGSSQPRVAKLENRDPEVSLDLQMKAIFASRPRAPAEFAALIRKWSSPERASAVRSLRAPRSATVTRGPRRAAR